MFEGPRSFVSIKGTYSIPECQDLWQPSSVAVVHVYTHAFLNILWEKCDDVDTLTHTTYVLRDAIEGVDIGWPSQKSLVEHNQHHDPEARQEEQVCLREDERHVNHLCGRQINTMRGGKGN